MGNKKKTPSKKTTAPPAKKASAVQKCPQRVSQQTDPGKNKKNQPPLIFNNETQLRMTLNSVPIGFWEWHKKNNIRVSADFFSLFGHPDKSAQTTTLLSLIKLLHPDDRETTQLIISDHLKRKTDQFKLETRILDQKKRWQWIALHGCVVKSGQTKKPLHITGTCQNITQQKMTEYLDDLQKNIAVSLSACNNAAEAVQSGIKFSLKFPGIDACGLYLSDAKGGLALQGHHGLTPAFVKASRYHAPNSPEVKQISQGIPISRDALTPSKKNTYSKERLKFLMRLPIMQQKSILGCFALASHVHDHFSTQLIDNLCTFAVQLGNTLLRLQTLSALAQSEAQYRVMHEQSPLGIAVYNSEGHFIRANQAADAFFGIQGKRKFIQHNLLKNPELPQDIKRTLIQKKSAHWIYTTHFHRKKKRRINEPAAGNNYFDIQVTYFGTTPPEHASGYFVQIQDITERIAAQEALKQNEERFRIAAEVTSDFIYEWDIATDHLTWFGEFDKTLGYSPMEIPRTIAGRAKLIHPEDVRQLSRSVEEHRIATGEINDEYRVRTKDGHWRIWADRGAPVLNENGCPIKWIGGCRDITDQKTAETALQEAKFRFEAVIQNTPEIAVQGFSREGILCHWNKASESFYGFTSQEILGKHFKNSFLPGEAGTAFENKLAQIFRKGHSLPPEEWQITKKNGNIIWIYSSTFPIFFEGRVVEVFCMGVDITARKAAEDELRLSRDLTEETNLELEQTLVNVSDLARQAAIADAAKSQFLANVSHEIRTPMNSILGFAEMLLDSELSLEQRSSIETIVTSTETLMTLINDILDLSKVEAGQIELEKIPVDLESIIFETCEMVRGKANRKPIEILCHIDDLPDGLLGDPNRIRQILINLLGNAVKFTHQGEVLTKVQVIGRKNKLVNIRLTVEDTGIGITEDKLNSIFEPFTQADGSTSRLYGGTGLGLAISQKIVQLMQGKLTVNTKTGKGSAFHLDVWLDRPDKADSAATSAADMTVLPGLKLLVIDDSATSLSIFNTLAKKLQMTYATVQSFEQGIDRLQREHFHIILVDLHLPHLDVSLIRKQLSAHPDQPAAHIIALATHPYHEKTQYADYDGILVKPVRKSTLASLIFTLIHPEQDNAAMGRSLLQRDKHSRVTILVAEDNKSNQEIMQKMLEHMGHKVDVAANGQQVLQLVETNHYDLIFMDMQMPKMGGLEAAYILRQKGAAIPIIALTANAMIGDREKCIISGMNDYISKPVKRDTIIDMLNSYTNLQSFTDIPEILRILFVGEDDSIIHKFHEAFHKAFPMATSRKTTNGIEASVLFGSFFPNLLVIDLYMKQFNAFAMINFIKSETRYANTHIIAYNAQSMNTTSIQTLRNMGVAVVLTQNVNTANLISLAKQLFSNAYSMHTMEAATDVSLVESISCDLGISCEDYYDILKIFLKNTPDKIKNLKIALDAKDSKKSRDAAHSIKSSALSLRLHTIAEPASRLERLVMENTFLNTAPLFSTLQNAFEAVRLTLVPPTYRHAETPPS